MKKNLKRLALKREHRYNRKDRELYLLMRSVMMDIPQPFRQMAKKNPMPKNVSDGVFLKYEPFPIFGE